MKETQTNDISIMNSKQPTNTGQVDAVVILPERNSFGQWISYKKHPINKSGDYLLVSTDEETGEEYYEIARYSKRYNHLIDANIDCVVKYIPLPKL